MHYTFMFSPVPPYSSCQHPECTWFCTSVQISLRNMIKVATSSKTLGVCSTGMWATQFWKQSDTNRYRIKRHHGIQWMRLWLPLLKQRRIQHGHMLNTAKCPEEKKWGLLQSMKYVLIFHLNSKNEKLKIKFKQGSWHSFMEFFLSFSSKAFCRP